MSATSRGISSRTLESIEEPEIGELLARSHMYRLLSFAYLYPSSERQSALRDGSYVEEIETASQRLPYYIEIRGEVEKLVSTLEGIADVPAPLLEAECNRLFGHSTESPCSPYETSYGIENTFSMTREMADIAGFYRAFGLSTASGWHDRVDHVSAELEFMHFITFKEAHAKASHQVAHVEIVREAEAKFLKDHLLKWLGSFAEILSKSSKIQYYVALGELTRKFLILEGAHTGLGIRLDLQPIKSKPQEDFVCGVGNPGCGVGSPS